MGVGGRELATGPNRDLVVVKSALLGVQKYTVMAHYSGGDN